ncbi:Rho GTPase activation protein [Clohesyomyces aquaticus]|uniref:Rho GTPase activation protein n=1 Tax=Clohesyomyces aquaticus TaxID=1231657 RepID=A0A1Y2A632_9PLEO|nr:Rho GTPase activation protein [Clohesyomyces aquaticus]
MASPSVAVFGTPTELLGAGYGHEVELRKISRNRAWLKELGPMGTMPHTNQTTGETSSSQNRQSSLTPSTAVSGRPRRSKGFRFSSWIKNSPKSKKESKAHEQEVRGIFGVSLITSIPYANATISLLNTPGESYIYGYVPVIVAKCGVYLKEKALNDPGGVFTNPDFESARVTELTTIFDCPPRWGKGLDWTGYSTHDAAEVLRRYLVSLPEPLMTGSPTEWVKPLKPYLDAHTTPSTSQSVSVISIYQQFMRDLPPLHRQLAVYLMDLFDCFADQSNVNGATTSRIAERFVEAFFASSPNLSDQKRVLEFLITNQEHFSAGMSIKIDQNYNSASETKSVSENKDTAEGRQSG